MGFDPRRILSYPLIYRSFQRLSGGPKSMRRYVNEFIKPKQGEHVLDIGCGPAAILEYLPKVQYWGFDMSQEYIDAAKEKFGTRGEFVCKKVSRDVLTESGGFDLALATGVLHHLNDMEAIDLLSLAAFGLKPAGRLVTLDGCYDPSQGRLAKYFVSRDRGEYVRPTEEYVKLARQVFEQVQVTVLNDLLRLPYTHIVMQCSGVKK